MKLRDIAHGRAGDKGDTCNISVIVFDRRDYQHVHHHVTAARVQECFGDVIFPGLERFGIDTSLGKRWLAERVARG